MEEIRGTLDERRAQFNGIESFFTVKFYLNEDGEIEGAVQWDKEVLVKRGASRLTIAQGKMLSEQVAQTATKALSAMDFAGAVIGAFFPEITEQQETADANKDAGSNEGSGGGEGLPTDSNSSVSGDGEGSPVRSVGRQEDAANSASD